ncbi:DUF7691 family protein [Armatimonas rosea]|uniref:DUF7691 domain-containing protein n=1 Tax=Armatimonas rosea TaxID=685828 RepID=A0A7W9SMK9_ARMRO|nr:hypothetical protein [Armatimonas rosea]MBB6048954.1 hypothetical protein [Armatimonas rosea]
MGYGLMVHSVDLDKILALCGSGNDTVRRSISGRFRQQIIQRNNDLDLSNERGEPSIFEGIRHLIMGGEKTLPGFVYSYAFEYLVEFYAKTLDNSLFYTCKFDWLREEIGEQLRAAGAVVEMDSLLFERPIDAPAPDDFPVYGHWKAAAAAASIAPLRAVENKSEELAAILAWCEFAASRGEGIVGYYY